MKRKEEEVLQALLSLQKKKVEITASGLVMVGELNITPREASWILKKFAEEVIKDKYFNQNIYVINMEMIQDEGADVCESE